MSSRLHIARRTLLVAAVTSGFLQESAIAQTNATEPDLDYEDFDGPLPTYRLFGTDPAAPAEVEMARSILAAAPRSKGSPLKVAQYFESLTDTNDQRERYNAAWAQRWNPVIVGFYKSTTLQNKYVLRKGDTIHWCAAFLNWCLEAADCKTTSSASSGSFRSFGTKTDTPKPGDIVVFKHGKPDLADQGRGHVGIYVGEDGERIKVLGGNQSAGRRYSSVNVSSFARSSSALVFHSFRSTASLVK